MNKNLPRLLLFIAILFITVSALLGCNAGKNANFSLIVPDNWELKIGDSRSVDYAFQEDVQERTLVWKAAPKRVAEVDKWGRVTALKAGRARITATNTLGQKCVVKLKVVKTPKVEDTTNKTVNYSGTAVSLGSALQKLVSYYAIGDEGIPQNISSIQDYTDYQTQTTADGAVWTIKPYGILRTDNNAALERDVEQRFMGDRYLYSKDGNLLGIVKDGANGIWTIMAEGITHIQMVVLSGKDKAALMSQATDTYVKRRGMVSEAVLKDGVWKPSESDNDGLWTSMYAAGELMRYSVLKNSGTATPSEIAAARQSAMISTEAVLLLSNLCMRTGTVEAYVRYQPNALFDPANGRYLSETALQKGGDNSLYVPDVSPAAAFEYAYEQYINHGVKTYFLEEDYLLPIVFDDWGDPREGGEYEKRTRNLEGYVARTYSLTEENNNPGGYMHWTFNGDGTATGTSTMSDDRIGYYINGENNRGLVVDASGEIPQRLWDDILGEGYTISEIVYKGDTSSDELIGHLFLYKLAFDILGAEDAEIKQIIASTMDRLAQHITDNGYMMVDGSGQPGTWSKYNREFFYNSSQLGGAPLTASVILSLFKVAHYVTGYQKWDDEYRMAALHPSYEYAKIMAQYSKQCYMVMRLMLDKEAPFLLMLMPDDLAYGTPITEMLTRLFLNYSDEEMAMLAFYILFQTEDDEELLGYYRDAIDQWWISIKYSENPLWYYIYQLAYPNKEVKDAYGNNIIETAAWSLSRHPIDLRKLSASNPLRDDYAELKLSGMGLDDAEVLCYKASGGTKSFEGIAGIINALAFGAELEWGVAAPDERAFHKYNNTSAKLHGEYNPNEMEGATTYTLPFWMGLYHNMLTD